MDFTELVASRRSIRAYKADKPVDNATVSEIIQFAQQAPSWKNSQTGRYYVVTSPEKLTEVKEKTLPDFNRNNCKNAPALIITTFVKSRSGFERDGSPTNELGDEWGAYDLGLQNQLVILKARELGLDTLIMGIRDEKALREALSIPETEEVVSVISLGYRDIDPEMPKRKATEDIVKFF
ncbi:MAG: nitroreductase family protein [Lachnospiraceae bacterium]|nr:nitroreductase family protein [Lachnospiraceae bacterium]